MKDNDAELAGLIGGALVGWWLGSAIAVGGPAGAVIGAITGMAIAHRR